jgi:hypothetical protein
MARIGGEIEQLGQLKASFDRESRTVEELTRTIRAQLQTTAWEGPAAERFRSMWSGEFRCRCANCKKPSSMPALKSHVARPPCSKPAADRGATTDRG